MKLAIGIITGLGVVTGGLTIIRRDKRAGMILIILAIIFPVVTSLWCSKKMDFAFGGTDWEFLMQTAIVDKMIEPWIILGFFIILLCSTINSLFKLVCLKRKNDC